jgi:hypothetical protein
MPPVPPVADYPIVNSTLNLGAPMLLLKSRKNHGCGHLRINRIICLEVLPLSPKILHKPY